MDKRSDDIRQDIESTRAALDEKVSMLENRASEVVDKAKQTFDLNHQVAERPWVTIGAAVAVGYVLGSLGGGSDDSYSSSSYSSDRNYSSDRGYSASGSYSQPGTAVNYNSHIAESQGPSTVDKVKAKSSDFLSQFDDEIEMIKGAAMATLTTFVRDAIREAVPALGQKLDQMGGARGTSGGATYGTSTSSNSFSRGAAGGTARSTAPNTSMDNSASAGRVNNDETPEWNRYGNPPPTPVREETDYYTTYQPDENASRTVGGEDRNRY